VWGGAVVGRVLLQLLFRGRKLPLRLGFHGCVAWIKHSLLPLSASSPFVVVLCLLFDRFNCFFPGVATTVSWDFASSEALDARCFSTASSARFVPPWTALCALRAFYSVLHDRVFSRRYLARSLSIQKIADCSISRLYTRRNASESHEDAEAGAEAADFSIAHVAFLVHHQEL
jgi:hypothetical protein